MANIDQVEATNMLAASLGKAAYTAATPPIMGRLMTANGTATANGTEVVNSGGSTYAAVNMTTPLNTPSAGAVTTNAPATWTNLPTVTTPGIQALELWDSAGVPKRKWFGLLAAAKVVALGDSLTIAAGALNISLG